MVSGGCRRLSFVSAIISHLHTHSLICLLTFLRACSFFLFLFFYYSILLYTQMTAIGHFSMLSETQWNPSLVAVVITLKGHSPYTIQDFLQQWQSRGMAERHPRFTWTVQKGSFDTRGAVQFALPVTEGLSPPSSSAHEARRDILGRIANMQFSMLDLTQSLWRAQVIPVMPWAVDFVERASTSTLRKPNRRILYPLLPRITTITKTIRSRDLCYS